MSVFRLQREDHVELRGVCWEPSGAATAAICLIHDFAEHMGRYEHVAAHFCAQGVALLGIDLRGHGLTKGQHASSIHVALADVSALLEHAAARFTGAPRILYGHGTGGAVVSNYVLRTRLSPGAVAGVVVTNPCFRARWWPIEAERLLCKTLHALRPDKVVATTDISERLSHDLSVGTAYASDPLVLRDVPLGAAFVLKAAGEWALAHARQWDQRVPLLVMHGVADPVTDPEHSKAFAGAAQGAAQLKLWDRMYHDPHHEINQAEVLAYTCAWLNKVVTGVQAASA